MSLSSSARAGFVRGPFPFLPIGLLLVAIVSIQAGAALAKGLFPVLGAEGATTLRLWFSALILLPVLRPWEARLTRAKWPALLGYGLSLGGMNLFYYLALARIPLGITVALELSGPLAVAFFASRRKVDGLWVLIAAGALLLLLPLKPSAQPLDPVGIAFALLAGACWAVYILAGKKAGQTHGRQAPALGMIVAALAVTPVGAVQSGAALFTPSVFPLVLAVAVLSSALPYTLEMFVLRRLPVRTFGTLMSLEPACAAAWGGLILHEVLTLQQWLAIGGIMLASLGAALTLQSRAGD